MERSDQENISRPRVSADVNNKALQLKSDTSKLVKSLTLQLKFTL